MPPLPSSPAAYAPRPLNTCWSILWALGCALLAPAVQADTATAPTAPKPLVYCTDASPEGFDPGLWDSASTNNANNQIFQGLLRFERGGTALQPQLATHWEISPDARQFTFHLRAGVRFQTRPWFSPGRTLNADDVLFTFGRFLDREHPFNKAFPATFVYPQNMGLAQMVEATGRPVILHNCGAARWDLTARLPGVALSCDITSWTGESAADLDGAVISELDCVADEVAQHLLQPLGVAADL